MLNALKVITEESSQTLRNLHQMQTAWLQEATPAPEDQPSAASAMAIAQHAMKVGEALNSNMLRQMHFWQNHLPNMFAALQSPTTFNNLMAFQNALIQRMTQQHTSWVEGWHRVLHEAGESHGANTMSKLMEQEFNISARMSALVVDQMTSMAELLENAQVDLGYLLSQSNPEKV